MRDGVHQKLGIGLKDALICQISARHPSSVTCGDSFPPGEALGAPAPVQLPDKLQFCVQEIFLRISLGCATITKSDKKERSSYEDR